VARSIINLAHGLHIPVLAEGVETEGQLGMLLADGCDQLQGYLFSRPVDAEQMTAMLRSGQRLSTHLKGGTSRERTLLLVDDEPSILSSLKRLFRREGYKLLTAQSGAEALELLACNPVDVIVSDQRMPGMTGVDFLRRTKALHPHTIRMTLSGFTDLQSIIDAVNEGAVYKFLTKPWDDDRLREHVAQAFAQKEMADENRNLQAQLAAANSEQAALNQRLARLLERQKVQSQLMQLSVTSLRDMIDALPVAVVGVAADGMLAFLNEPATHLMPEAAAALGDHPGPRITGLIHALRDEVPVQGSEGLLINIQGQPHRAWLSPMPQAHVTADAEAWDDRGDVLVLVPQKT
jgi:CheY-like chemotaxis protein